MAIRLAYLASHPIQYQAPLLRRIEREPGIDLTTLFLSDMSLGAYHDTGFGVPVHWDTDLVGGYRHEVLPSVGPNHRVTGWLPWSRLGRALSGRRFDAVWLHGYVHPTMLRALALARHRGLPVLVRGESQAGDHPGLVPRGIRKGLLPPLLRAPRAFLAIGARNRRYYLAHGADPDRIFPMPYAVDNAHFRQAADRATNTRDDLRAELDLPADRPVIVMASKLLPHKGPVDLLDAYTRLSPDGRREPDALLVFVGDGPLRPGLEAAVRSRRWRSVRFAGFRNQSELPRFYDLADVFVLPSHREPWGLVVNEAMNAGRPVVVSDVAGCVDDLVIDGDTGYRFPAGDVPALTARIRALLDDASTRQRMGSAARQRVGALDFEADVAGLHQALVFACGARPE
jgi:glycosyltransferase involved in cell wall biosynthesis